MVKRCGIWSKFMNTDGHTSWSQIDSSTLDGSIRVGGPCAYWYCLCSINILTSQRGEHDIENQMIFEGNPGFIFHDSRGFESGDTAELNMVQSFIDRRSKARSVNEQLHAIWCVNPSNFFMQRKMQWICVGTAFQQVTTVDPSPQQRRSFSMNVELGLVCVDFSPWRMRLWLFQVPVIVLWTKTDSLDNDRIMQLVAEGKTLSEAKQQAPQQAWAEYEQRIYPRFALFNYPPKAFVVLRSKCYTYSYWAII